AGRYEEAAAALERIDATSLPSAQQQIHGQYARLAADAATQRRAARDAFARGEAQLTGGEVIAAIDSYKTAANNQYADAGTRNKAREQLVLSQARLEQNTDLNTVFAEAKTAFEAGQVEEARVRFSALEAIGFTAPLYETAPAGYL